MNNQIVKAFNFKLKVFVVYLYKNWVVVGERRKKLEKEN